MGEVRGQVGEERGQVGEERGQEGEERGQVGEERGQVGEELHLHFYVGEADQTVKEKFSREGRSRSWHKCAGRRL